MGFYCIEEIPNGGAMKTFFSFIGKGQVLKDAEGNVYLKACYDFGEGFKYETACFADAVRLSGKYEFDEALLIGSETSSWSTLLENDENAQALWKALNGNEGKGIPLGGNAENLRQALENLWGKPIRLCVNVPDLLPENSEKILDKYIGALLDSGQDILLDITHGYRWMPILLTSVLQIANAYRNCGSNNIDVIYGELNRNADSPVRHLDILIKGQNISDAVSLFAVPCSTVTV